MFIVDSERSEIVNVDNVISICFGRNGCTIVANVGDEEPIILGAYDNPQRASKVFDQMLNIVFPDNLRKNKEPRDIKTYYMPED